MKNRFPNPIRLFLILAFTSSSLFAQEESSTPKHKPNRLANESSPYLLQHAYNPVDWYAWGPEAFEKAAVEGKPIFLSIGYSSCFWCHVMERKVFENEAIAQFMNEHFINIKVDREERPDVDEVYMLSLQVYLQLAGSSQGGGWPLSMFLTPDGEPIAGGTYFPPEDMPGRPGFLTVMQQVDAAWTTQKAAVQRTAKAVAREVKRLSQPTLSLDPVEVNLNDVAVTVEDVLSNYDPEHGGFDFQPSNPNKPKFPVPSKLMLIQAQLARKATAEPELAQKLDHSLRQMAEGGIYDQLGDGFHRYSTDREWLVPHFEKMLYDNAQLAEVYVEAYQRTQRQQYRDTAEGIFSFVDRRMTDPKGGFYSALDAETDGIEGKYYIWSKDEVQETLGTRGYKHFAAVYGLDAPQTFEHGYVLHLPQSIEETAAELGIPRKELETRLKRLKTQLLEKRQQRKPLRRDDKILTSWNGLMIRAYARAGKILQRQDYVDKASHAALHLLSTLRDQEGRLLRSARNHQASLPAYLDDYAFLVSGLLALHEATQQEKWLNAARLLTDQQISLFHDSQQGGFYFTAHDHESLIARTKSAYDSVLPSGNSVSIQNLTRLAKLTGDSIYVDIAQKSINAFSQQLRQSPGSLAYFSLASQEFLEAFGSKDNNTLADRILQGGLSSSNEADSEAMKTETQPKDEELVVHLMPQKLIGKDPKIQPKGYFSQSGAQPGKTLKVAVQIKIDEGWHINANPAQPDFVIPTQLSTRKEDMLRLQNVSYPPGHEFRLKGIEEALLVYEGTVKITAELLIPADAVGIYPITLTLKSQACNNQTCFPPLTINLSGSIPILTDDQIPQPINGQLFETQIE